MELLCIRRWSGGVGILVAVEFVRQEPVGRSAYVLAVRKGIRYPDDVWSSIETGKPITSTHEADISMARFIFQSRQPNGSSTDLFVADFDGKNLCNLTYKDEIAYDGLFDDAGNEVAFWLDEQTIQYCSMRDGNRRIVKRKDCGRGVIGRLRKMIGAAS